MKAFEEKLRKSAQQLASHENQALRIPSNPLAQVRVYWGWIAAPAAALAGVVLGMSLDLLAKNTPETHYVQTTDTIRIDRLVRDTIYITQVVEKGMDKSEHKATHQPSAEKNKHLAKDADTDTDTTTCTSVQCDGINYAILALK